ncbi:MAG: hypothetical protein QOE14_1445, partial [Humisphaera sp.]|nr:hypothetical protein [Humisphaera sp.]
LNVFNDSIFADVNSIRSQKFARMVRAVDADIWALQECYNHTPAQLKALMDTIAPQGGSGWYVFKNGFNEHAIVSKYPISLTANNTAPAGYRAVAMARIDLPDPSFARDLYFMNAHYRCCGDTLNDPDRQKQSDAFVNWMRDARTPGGSIDLPDQTAMMVLGDFNIVGGPQPLNTLLDGNIQNNLTYGGDSPPDWDGTANAQAIAYQNAVAGGDTWTWRDDTQIYNPGRLDYITYTDSVLAIQKSFVLNTVTMTAADRAAAGLQTYDSIYDNVGSVYDHLPVIADFQMTVPEPSTGLLMIAAAALTGLRRRRSLR